MNILKYIGASFLLASTFSYSDILVNISATMMSPVCDISSVNNSSPVRVNFGTVNVGVLNKQPITQDFSISIKNCDFNKNLGIVLSSKNTGSIIFEGKNILGTSTPGLGIQFSDITGTTATVLEIGKIQAIKPKVISQNTEYQLNLRTRLVSSVSDNQLNLGKFNATATLMVVYF